MKSMQKASKLQWENTKLVFCYNLIQPSLGLQAILTKVLIISPPPPPFSLSMQMPGQ
jgi:hypothetical protein